MTRGWPLWSKSARPVLAGASLILITDQITKLYVLHILGMAPGDKITLTPFFDLLFIWNRGISYGLFQQESDLGRWLLVFVGLGACVFLWVWLNRAGLSGPLRKSFALGVMLVLGGGIGNTIDRIAYGAVADFVSLHAFGYYWYIFNIADVAIVAGFAALLYDMLRAPQTSS